MKMVTLTIDYPPQTGGVANYSKAVCDYFSDHMEVLSNNELHFMSGKFPRWIGALKLLLERNDDVILVHHVLPLGLVAFLNWRRNKVPYIVFFHGMDFELATRNVWKRFLTRKILRNAHTVVGNSKYLANELQRFSGRDTIVVHPMPAIRAGESRSKREDSLVNIVSVGRFVERKGFDRVLRVIAKMPELHSQISYTILGDDGDYVNILQGLIDELELNEVVTVITNAGENDIRPALESAGIFAMPTVTRPNDRESFGIVYLEAASFGVPSIASRVEGVDEAVINNETGILVDSDDELLKAIKSLVTDYDLRNKLGAAAQVRVNRDFKPNEIFAELQERLRDIDKQL